MESSMLFVPVQITIARYSNIFEGTDRYGENLYNDKKELLFYFGEDFASMQPHIFTKELYDELLAVDDIEKAKKFFKAYPNYRYYFIEHGYGLITKKKFLSNVVEFLNLFHKHKTNLEEYNHALHCGPHLREPLSFKDLKNLRTLVDTNDNYLTINCTTLEQAMFVYYHINNLVDLSENFEKLSNIEKIKADLLRGIKKYRHFGEHSIDLEITCPEDAADGQLKACALYRDDSESLAIGNAYPVTEAELDELKAYIKEVGKDNYRFISRA